jgi:hypothetical protein
MPIFHYPAQMQALRPSKRFNDEHDDEEGTAAKNALQID